MRTLVNFILILGSMTEEREFKEKLYSLVQANSLEQKKRTIDNLLGLRLSKNGFGIKPYGEEAKDWLDLSQIRVQTLVKTLV